MSKHAGALVLPPHISVAPVADLPSAIRSRISCADDDFALSVPGSRMPTRILDAEAARLLEEFRKPKTIVEAILSYSRSAGSDPERVLEEAYPLLGELASAGILLREGEEIPETTAPTLQEGESLSGYRITRCLTSLDDTEVYRATSGDGAEVALKVARPERAPAVAELLENEAAILRRLAGRSAPRLVEEGIFEGRPFLATEWVEGLSVLEDAERIRSTGGEGSRERLRDLCVEVLRVYAALHDAGILHSDIHPNNMIVAGDGEVRLVDFGLARRVGTGNTVREMPRGGVAFFYEPEFAGAMLQEIRVPASSEKGEQYALAAICYLLITGEHYFDFRLEQSEIMQQIAEEPPRPFLEAGVEPWPEVEAVLARALSKDPDDRFDSVSDLAEAMRAAETPPPEASRPRGASPAAERVLQDFLARVGPGGRIYAEGLPAPPYSSVMFGAAGLAYALYRIACAREDGEHLALSDLWSHRALAQVGNHDAYYNRDLELTPELLGPNALFHTASGVHMVAALIALARGDLNDASGHAEAFLREGSVATENLDLTMGETGVLLGCTLLRETGRLDHLEGLGETGSRVAGELWSTLEASPAIPESSLRLNLGMAHGWAGVLYALLRWHRVAGTEAPAGIGQRLRELAETGETAGGGLRWPWRDPRDPGGPASYMAGWCNGSAGFVFLWTLAARVLEDASWLELAEKAARYAWESRPAAGNVCCGAAGAAYSFLNLERSTGDSEWGSRAESLVEASVRHRSALGETPDSLYKGEPGLALLIAESARSSEARMPIFEEEGWVRST